MKSKAPSQRQLRVGEEIRHILAEVLSRGHTGDNLLDNTSITVSEVRVSPDLGHASVYVLPLGGLHTTEILKALKDKAGFFRKEVARKLTTRVAPRLVFHADTSFDEANRIEVLLKTPRVRQDIEK
jgi:ribosome-binding factor A